MAPLNKTLVEKLVKEPVKSFTTGEGSKKGDNVAGNLLAVKVQTESGKEFNLVHKTLPDTMQKEFAVAQQTFWVENAFYADFAPALETWAKSRGFKSPTATTTRDSVLPIPKFMDGFNNDNDDYVCLEDLRPKGYKMADKYIGLTLEETSLVMKELGQYHALTYGFIQWEGEKIFDKKEFKILGKKMTDDEMLMKQGTDMFKSTYKMSIDLVRKRDKKLADKMETAVPTSIEDVFSTGFGTDKKYFPVIIFGDLWVNNILFKYGANGSPEALNFIDFQLTRRGNIYEDLQYFIFTSTTPEFRRKYLTQVLDIYYESFMSTITAVNCHPPLNFTKGVFFDSFRENYLSAFYYICFAIPMQLGEPMDFGPPPPGTTGEPAESGDAPPQIPPEFAGPPPGVDPMEFQLQMMAIGLRTSMDNSPRALDRLYEIATEMAALKVF